jgi:adenylyltransferase/sulfurtransferase
MFKEIKHISVSDLKLWRDESKEFLLIDVRSPDEYKYANLEGELIPMQEIPENISKIPKDRPVVFHCHHGSRSKKVISWLQEQADDFDKLYNLEGGIHAWSEEIDTNVPMY